MWPGDDGQGEAVRMAVRILRRRVLVAETHYEPHLVDRGTGRHGARSSLTVHQGISRMLSGWVARAGPTAAALTRVAVKLSTPIIKGC